MGADSRAQRHWCHALSLLKQGAGGCSPIQGLSPFPFSHGVFKEAPPAECPVCYEKFQPLEHTHRRLSCGHVFCHDCLVKCLLSAKLDGQVQSSIICPVCRYVTFLSKKKALCPEAAPGEALPSGQGLLGVSEDLWVLTCWIFCLLAKTWLLKPCWWIFLAF
uniref:RING-type domain-containing protein n=1 Tax=Anas zonorhyncha TaxID=75864 RepID=A0A8B9UTJ8_9AVES